MADNIANILMRIGGESSEADDTLAAFLGKLKAFGETTATAEADVRTGPGASKLTALGAQLAKFDKARAIAQADVNVQTASLTRAIGEIQAFDKLASKRIEIPVEVERLSMDRALLGLQGLIRDRKLEIEPTIDLTELQANLAKAIAAITSETKTLPDVGLDINLNDTAALAQLAVFRAAVGAIHDQHVEVDVDTANLQSLQTILRQLASEQVDVTVGVDDSAALSRLTAFMVAAQGVARDIHLGVEVDDAEAKASLAELLAEMQVADSQRIKIDVDTDKLSLASLAASKFASAMSGLASKASAISDSIGGVTVNLGAFGVKLTATTGFVLALAAAMAVSLVAALSLLISSLASAAAAVGVLATAFVASLGPAVAVAAATVGRIVQVVQALKAKRDAEKAAAAGSSQSVAAEEQRHNSLLAVGQALRSVESAERGRAKAVQDAQDAIHQATNDQAAASRAAAAAAQNLKTQTVAAYDAMRQAAEDVRDAILDVEDAQLGIEASSLATKRAELELRKLRGEAGLAGKELNDAFNKFTDVDFGGPIASFTQALNGAGGATPEETQLQLEEAILAVRQAKLNEKKATDALGDSEKSLSDKRKTAADFAQRGIAAFGPYTDALNQQRDATIRLADATERSNRLQAAGVSGAPSVIAANEAVADAQRRLTEARHDAARAAEGAAGGEAARKAKQEWDDLSKTEQNFALALEQVRGVLKTTFGPAVNGVLNGLMTAFAQLPSILAPLKGSFTNLGNAIGRSIGAFATALNDPAVSNGLIKLINGAAQLATVLGGKAFQGFFLVMLNIANAAMPLLLSAMQAFANLLTDLSHKTDDPKKLGTAFSSLGQHLFGILALVKQVGRIFLGFFAATSGNAKGFVKTLTDMAKGLADFIASAKGQKEIKDFFNAVIPLAVQTLKFIGNAIVALLQIVEAISPALTGVLAAINLLFGGLNRVLDILKPFLKVAAQIAVLFLGGLPAGVAKFLGKFKLLEGIASLLTKNIVGVVATIVARLGFIASVIPTIFDKVKDIVLAVISFIGRQFGRVTDIVVAPFRAAITAIGKLGKGFFDAGKAVIKNIIEGIKSLAGDIGGVAGKVFKFLVDKLPGSEPKDKSSPLAGLAKRGKAIMENLAAGIPLGKVELAGALHRSLVPVVAGIDHNITAPRTGAASGAVGQAQVVPATHIEKQVIELKTPSGEMADPTFGAVRWARMMQSVAGGIPQQD